MYFVALATDYDGTLAEHGQVDAETLDALERLKASGRTLILVTGRELPDLRVAFPELDRYFDMVVVENGALLYLPPTAEERPIAPEPPVGFVENLRARGVDPLSVGRGIVATWEPNQAAVLEAIHELGLEWQIIFNKGAVMVLPPGVNKASGLASALDELKLSPLNVIGVGDAENDHAFLTLCGCSVAVSNALDAVKATADVVTAAARGAGVVEVIDRLLEDGAGTLPLPERHRIQIGVDNEGRPATLGSDGGGVLIAGSSGIGKSTLATAILERLADRGFQFCVLDPEGDYDDLESAVVFGDAGRVPASHEVLDLLAAPTGNLAVNMLGLEVNDRPGFFADLLPRIAAMRARNGRPHWILIDEAHHLLPAQSASAPITLPTTLPATIYVTVHPDQMAPQALAGVSVVLAVGDKAPEVVTSFCEAIGVEPPPLPVASEKGEVLFWDRNAAPPFWITAEKPRQAHKRHTRKYAEGTLGEDKSFYFRGPEDALNLRAQNLMLFLQIADGVDDATWLHHLRRGDYSTWFRMAIKDDELADEVAAVEAEAHSDAAATRARVREAVSRRYTAPAD